MTDEERKLLRDHLALLKQFPRFICVACLMPRTKVGKVDIFRPEKAYKLCRMTTYILCDECLKLPDEEIYKKVETWMAERGHLVA